MVSEEKGVFVNKLTYLLCSIWKYYKSTKIVKTGINRLIRLVSEAYDFTEHYTGCLIVDGRLGVYAEPKLRVS